MFSSLRIGETLEDLAQFAAIQPDTPALLAKINFNVLPVSQDQVDITVRTLHVFAPFIIVERIGNDWLIEKPVVSIRAQRN